MAAQRETVLYDIHDFKVYPLLTDSSSASPTYGAGVDVPGVGEMSTEPNIISNELKGDARVIAKKGRIDRFNVSATFAKVALDVFTAVFGGTTTNAGAGSSEEAYYDLVGPAPLPYFKAEFRISDVDEELADVHAIFYKCQLTGGTFFGQASDQFGQPSVQFEAISPEYLTTPMIRIRLLEASTALSS